MRGFISLLLVFALIVASVFGFGVWMNGNTDLFRGSSPRKLLRQWENETSVSLASVVDRDRVFPSGMQSSSFILNERTLRLDEGVSCNPKEVFSIKDGRVFFLCTGEEGGVYGYRICSVTTAGKDYRSHALLLSFGISESQSYGFESLTHIKYYAGDARIVGLYSNGSYFIKDLVQGTAMKYDIDADKLEQVDDLPEMRNRVDVGENNDYLFISDSATGIERKIDLEYLSERNQYLKELLELSEEKGYKGESIRTYKIIDQDLYIVVEVVDRLGEGYETVFRYDINEESLDYVTWMFVSDVADGYYVLEAER